jgi:hypothetical protein
MNTRQVKRFVAGKWNPIKWSEIKIGDTLRIYDRGHGFHDGTINTFIATSDGSKASGVWSFNYGDAMSQNALSHVNVHSNELAANHRGWRNLKKRKKGTKKEK